MTGPEASALGQLLGDVTRILEESDLSWLAVEARLIQDRSRQLALRLKGETDFAAIVSAGMAPRQES